MHLNTLVTNIEVGTGVSHAPDGYVAGVTAASDARLNIRQFPLSVALIYASVHYNLDKVLAGIIAAIGNVPILGTTTAGEICGGTHQHSVTVVIIASPYLAVHAATGNGASEDWRRALTQAIESPAIAAYVKGEQNLNSELISSGKSLFAMIFYPGNTRAASSMGYELLESFKQISLGRIPVFGGASADDWLMESNSFFIGGQVHHDSVLVAIFETQLEVGISLGHGFLPIGQKMTVTAIEGHEILSLNQTPAADVLANSMGKSRNDLEGQHITLTTGYPIGTPDPMNQYSVNIASYFTQRGGVRMTQPVSVGSELTLLVHDADNSVLAGQEAVRKAMIRAGTNSPSLILVHYCALRPRIMGESLAQMEIGNLLEIASPAPMAGFFSFGEDAVADDGISRHNNGAVAVLILGNQFSPAAKVAQENKRLIDKIAEQERANTANLSRVMFENSPTGMVAIDPGNGRIIQANNFELNMLGYASDEILTKTVSDLTHPDDRAESQQRYEQLANGIVNSSHYEKRFLRKDSSYFWADVNISSVKDINGKISLIIGNAVDITERKQAENDLRNSHQQIHTLLNSMAEGAYGVDTNGNCTFVNQSFLRILGFEQTDEIIGRHIHELIHHSHPDGSPYPATECKMYNAYLLNQKIHVTDEVFWKKDGTSVPVEYWSQPIFLGEVMQGAIATFVDITERAEAESQIKKSLSLLRATLESTADAILVVDLNNVWRLHNQQFIDLWNIPEEIIAAQDDNAALTYVIKHLENPGIFLKKVRELYDSPRAKSFDTLNFKDGRIIERFSIPQMLDGGVVGRVWSFRDVTERRIMEEQVHQLAFYDALTKLPNRRLLNDRLSQTMAYSKRTGLYGALMFLDLDNFKPLNDTHGHVAGDLLLIEVANRLKNCVRKIDTVARFGGDEFVVIINELGTGKVESTVQANIVAEKIRSSLAEPYHLTFEYDGKADKHVTHHCSTSIGVAVFVNHEASQEDVLKRADIAMYQAKEDGKNLIRFFDAQHGIEVPPAEQGTQMLHLIWHDSYGCGEPTIDQEHRKLFDLANALIGSAFAREQNPQKFDTAMEKLLAHVVQHFADEEAILALHHYAVLDDHKVAHKVLIDHALQLRDKASAGYVTIGELVNFLADEVVAQHMLKEDRKFYPLFDAVRLS